MLVCAFMDGAARREKSIDSNSGPPRGRLASWPRVTVGLGSNLGDRDGCLVDAATGISRYLLGTAISPPLESSPQDCPAGSGMFLNAVLTGATRLAPEELLGVLKSLELEAGRVRGERNAPRTLDCDLLCYGGLVVDRPELSLPHPRLQERPFWLLPLRTVAPRSPLLGGSNRRISSTGTAWTRWSAGSASVLAAAGIHIAEPPSDDC